MVHATDPSPTTRPARMRSRPAVLTAARNWVRLVRPVQWSKNAVVLAGVVFARMAGEPSQLLHALVALVAFCMISSSMYIFNDWLDMERDRHHPLKRFRPLASGAITPRQALPVSGALAIASLALAWAVTPALALIVALYALLMTTYTLWLKRIVIIDVFVIAGGFLLRAIAGAVAVDVPISAWLMLCTVLLALFLGFCKRRNEMLTLQDTATLHRDVLRGYTPAILDQFILLTASTTIMAYAMYTFTSTYVPENDTMMITVPIVAFAIFRYLYLVYVRKLGGAPESLLFRDLPLLSAVALWGASVLVIFWLQ
ncbi:MAG TPA: decaprenyl-phosphate phosphoribosyltransferase [Thermomicrobiales bacterium]|nr:decaprenyl-phosphate phosphoribosyltransferase [Thermomicrobiales bacterium]